MKDDWMNARFARQAVGPKHEEPNDGNSLGSSNSWEPMNDDVNGETITCIQMFGCTRNQQLKLKWETITAGEALAEASMNDHIMTSKMNNDPKMKTAKIVANSSQYLDLSIWSLKWYTMRMPEAINARNWPKFNKYDSTLWFGSNRNFLSHP
jgi:hypothetical protein